MGGVFIFDNVHSIPSTRQLTHRLASAITAFLDSELVVGSLGPSSA